MNLPELDPAWWVAGAAGLVLLLWLIRWIVRRRRRRQGPPPQPGLEVDLTQLDVSGPPEEGPRLEFYGTPVRLAVLVLAPGGRGSELPPPDMLPALMERLVPGLSEVLAAHEPYLFRWPAQLSSQGFAQAFFNHVPLPGDRGKGTVWCSIAGRIAVGERSFLIGLVCRTTNPNSLSQFVVRHEGQWLDILRIRSE